MTTRSIGWRVVEIVALAWAGCLPGSAVSAAGENPPQFEVESLFPMYLMDGYHLAVGVHMNQWRLRASCINGGNYDYEPNNKTFKRNLGNGCGLFFGYFFHRGWHAYLYVERQQYIVAHRGTAVSATFPVTDIGPGIGYQYFFTKGFYLQPALHLYWREKATKNIDGIDYTLPNIDISPTLRIGYQF